jgi:tape measure domain-containing protein
MPVSNSQLGNLYVGIKADATQALKEIDKVNKAAIAAAKAVNKLGAGGGKGSPKAPSAPKVPPVPKGAGNSAVKEASRVSQAIQKIFGQGLLGGLKSSFGSLSSTFSALGALRYNNWPYAISQGLRVLVGASGNALKSFGAIGGGLLDLAKQSAILGPIIARIGSAFAALGAAAGPLTAVIGVAVVGAIAYAGQAAVRAAVQFAGLAAQAAVVGLSLKKVFSAGFETGNQLEQSTITLKAVLGERAKVEQEFLTQRGKASVYDYLGLQDIDRTLLAFNVVDDKIRRGLIDTLITLGTVGGRSTDQLQFAARALGQISSNGTPLRQDILQLVQSLGVSETVLTYLPEYAGKSTKELRKMLEQGLIPSAKFFQAMGVYAGQFQGVAEEAANTVQGKLQKLQDTKVDIGKAFIAGGVQAKVAGLLDKVLQLLNSIDFTPIGRGFAAVFDAISLGLGKVVAPGSGGDIFKQFFQVTLPNALYGVARIAYIISTLVGGLFTNFISGIAGSGKKVDQFSQASKALVSTFVAIAKLGARALLAVRYIVAIGKKILNVFIAVAKTIGAVIKAIIRLFKRDLSGAKGELSGVDDLWNGIIANLDPRDELDRAGRAYRDFVGRVEDAADRANGIEFQPFVDPNQNAGNGVGAMDTGFGEDAAAADEAAKKVADLRNSLYELVKRVYGLRSELEQGLLGDKGFTATAEQIASMGEKVTQILRDLGKASVANTIDGQVRLLMRLADVREVIAKKLEEATKRLSDAIKARDDFAKQIKDQAYDFVNALKLEEESVTTIKTFKVGGITGYMEIQSKRSENFVQAMRRRLEAFRKFNQQTRLLLRRGLDKGLLEQIVAAGPEQAGEVVNQLVAGGDQAIRTVNDIQRELGQTATTAGTQAGRDFYQVGVDQAQAQVNGLQSQINAVTDAAQRIGAAIYNAVVPFAERLREAWANATPSSVPTPSQQQAPPAPRQQQAPPAPRGPSAPSAPQAPRPVTQGRRRPPVGANDRENSWNPNGPSAQAQQARAIQEFLNEINRRIFQGIYTIESRNTALLRRGVPERQRLSERQMGYEFLARAFNGTTLPDSTGYNFTLYIGGQRIAEYVDVELRDRYNRERRARRQSPRNERPIRGVVGGYFEQTPSGLRPRR